MTKKRISIIVGVVIACVVIVVVAFGLFPVARVNGRTILYRDVASLETSTLSVRGYLSQEPTLKLKWNDASDVKQAVVEEMIIRAVIDSSLDEFNRGEIQKEIQDRAAKIDASTDIKKISNGLDRFYHMSYPEFRRLVIIPQLLESIVQERVEASGKKYGDWLEAKGKSADVRIYFLPYVWRDGKLEHK